MRFNSILQLFEPASLVYLLSNVRQMVELGDYLKQQGVKKPLTVLNNSPESKYLEAFGLKKLQKSSFNFHLILNLLIILLIFISKRL